MSRASDGRCLHCDGPGCDACVPVPVILRTVRASDRIPPRWLFVQEGNAWRHYCPQCAARNVVARITEERFEETDRAL